MHSSVQMMSNKKVKMREAVMFHFIKITEKKLTFFIEICMRHCTDVRTAKWKNSLFSLHLLELQYGVKISLRARTNEESIGTKRRKKINEKDNEKTVKKKHESK